jgi:hypothetical protein
MQTEVLDSTQTGVTAPPPAPVTEEQTGRAPVPSASSASKKLKEQLARLEEPFDLEVISWKPQVSSYRDPENPVAKGAAYADQRAYSDRLNELFGPSGWTREYSVHVVSGVERITTVRNGSQREEKRLPNQAKVFVVAKVTIGAIGTHTGTGESWVDDDNAFTIAEAQAFKRACVCFGLGRYLYELPETDWLPIDKFTRQFKVTPVMPDWAIPKRKLCKTCGDVVKERTINRVQYTAEALVKRGVELYGQELCAECQIQKAREIQRKSAGQQQAAPGTRKAG